MASTFSVQPETFGQSSMEGAVTDDVWSILPSSRIITATERSILKNIVFHHSANVFCLQETQVNFPFLHGPQLPGTLHSACSNQLFFPPGCQLSHHWAAAVGGHGPPVQGLELPLLPPSVRGPEVLILQGSYSNSSCLIWLLAHPLASSTWEEDRHRQMLSSVLPQEPTPFVPDVRNKLSVCLFNSPPKCDNEKHDRLIRVISLLCLFMVIPVSWSHKG